MYLFDAPVEPMSSMTILPIILIAMVVIAAAIAVAFILAKKK